MAQFEEPEVLATFDRSFGDKHEQLRFERGSFNGRATYTLRVYWQADDGQWRWSQAKPTSSGKVWASLNLKAKELRTLGEMLIAESEQPQPAQGSQPQTTPVQQSRPAAAPTDDMDSIPF